MKTHVELLDEAVAELLLATARRRRERLAPRVVALARFRERVLVIVAIGDDRHIIGLPAAGGDDPVTMPPLPSGTCWRTVLAAVEARGQAG